MGRGCCHVVIKLLVVAIMLLLHCNNNTNRYSMLDRRLYVCVLVVSGEVAQTSRRTGIIYPVEYAVT